jgi:hypothetical protein
VVERRPVAAPGSIVGDTTVRLPERLAASRRNPLAKAGRMVVVRLDGGTTLRPFTNDPDRPAETIADLYETRWQIAAAIITCLLLKLLHNAARTKKSAAHFFAGVRHALFHRIEVATLVGRIERQRACLGLPPSPQLELTL